MSVQHALAAGLEISVDLQPQALYHLDFLKEIDDLDHFRDQTFIERAVYRYEALWMPFAARHEVLVPPIDIHWVWLCHMLSPVTYAKDCVNVVGKVLDHRFMSVRENTHLQSTSRELWTSEYPSEPYDFRAQGSSDIESNTNGDSRISYDLVSAALRQTSFFYHVSLPHYRDSKFLEDASQRYRQFLFMAAENRTSFLVPCYDIDLIWHTHMSHPLEYQQDTNAIMGEVFNHDDSDGNREVGSKLQICANKTEDIWKAMFNENYLIAGTMYRGTPTKHVIQGTSITWSDYPKRQLYFLIKRYTIEAESLTKKRLRNQSIIIKLSKTDFTLNPLNVYLNGSAAKQSVNKNRFSWSYPEGFFIIKDYMKLKVRMEIKTIRRKFCYSQSSSIGWVTKYLHFDQLAKPDYEHSDNITFKLHGFRFTIEFLVSKTTIDQTADMSFEAKQGSFEETAPLHKNTDMNILWPVLEDNHTNDHAVTWTRSRLENNFGQSTVDVTIAHCVPLLTSVIQVRCRGRIKAVAHLLQPGELPLSEQVADEFVPTQDVTQGERAVIICGDWALLVGRWTGRRRSKSCKTEIKDEKICDQTIRFERRASGKKGSQGYLELDVYMLKEENKNTKLTTRNSLKVGPLSVGFIKAHIELNRSCTEIAEYIAYAYSLALLHVVCVWRPNGWTKGQSIHSSSHEVEKIPSHLFMEIIGLYENTPINQILKECEIRLGNNEHQNTEMDAHNVNVVSSLCGGTGACGGYSSRSTEWKEIRSVKENGAIEKPARCVRYNCTDGRRMLCRCGAMCMHCC